MTEPTDHKLSRRRFGAIMATGAGAIVAGGAAVFTLFDDDGGGGRPRRFTVAHDQSVYVTMTAGAEFVVEVKRRGTGEVLERHDGVTARNLLDLESEHVAFGVLA